MITYIKKILTKTFPSCALYYKAYQHLINNSNSYLHETGWMNSLALGKPVDNNGNCIPWMNFPVVVFLKERLSNDFTLFEYGSGYSTIFFASRVNKVRSIEYDQKWYAIVKDTMPANVELIFVDKDEDGKYCRAIKQTSELYDIVVVDGRDRVNCLKYSLNSLSERGVVLLDDSHRERYNFGINYYLKNNFKMLSFEGLKASGAEVERTTIFYREGNCLKI